MPSKSYIEHYYSFAESDFKDIEKKKTRTKDHRLILPRFYDRAEDTYFYADRNTRCINAHNRFKQVKSIPVYVVISIL